MNEAPQSPLVLIARIKDVVRENTAKTKEVSKRVGELTDTITRETKLVVDEIDKLSKHTDESLQHVQDILESQVRTLENIKAIRRKVAARQPGNAPQVEPSRFSR